MSSAVTGKGVPVKVPNRSIRLSVLRLVRMAVAFVVVAGSLGLATVTATAQDGGSSCPSDGADNYSDVVADSTHADNIACLRELGISEAGDTYRPGEEMTRSEMAAFMANAYQALTGEEAPIADHEFTDIEGDRNEDDIARISPNGLAITTGTTDTTYSPDDTVIRGHMALFLTRLYKAVAGSDAPAGDTEFTDIGDSNLEEQTAIGQIFALEVTTGTTPTTYSPSNNVTREQMGSFVARMYRALDALPDPAEAPGAPTGVEVAISGEDGDALDVSWTAPEESGTSDVTGYVVQSKSGDDDYSADDEASVDGTSTNFGALTQGDTYTFRVAAVSDDGQSDWSDEASGNPAVAPGLVGELTSSPGNGTLALSWTAPEDDGGSEITGYVVSWRTGRQASADTADVAGDVTGYTIIGLSNSLNYSVWVAAVNAAGTGETASVPAGTNSVSVSPTPTASTAPQNLTVTPTDGELHVSWTAPADDGGTVLLHYTVERRCVTDDGNSGWVTTGVPTDGEIADVPTRQLQETTITGLANGNACEVRVQANSYNDVNEDGMQNGTPTDMENAERTLTSPRAEGSGTPVTLPNAPGAAPEVTTAHESLQITWNAPEEDGGSDITGYKVIWDAGIPAEAIVPAEPRMYTIIGLDNQYAYMVTIKTITAVGESMDASDPGPGTPDPVPAAPTNVQAVVPPQVEADGTTEDNDGMKLDVTWNAPPSNGTSVVTSYNVQYQTSAIPGPVSVCLGDVMVDDNGACDAGSWSDAAPVVATMTTHTFTGLMKGVSYNVRVQAVNSAGTDAGPGPYGVGSGTPATLPDVVVTTDVVPGYTSLDVTWVAPGDNGSDITHYLVRYARDVTHNEPYRSDIRVNAPLTRVNLTGLAVGIDHVIQIQAVNGIGTGPNADTDFTGTTGLYPNAPASVTAVPKVDGNGTMLTVTWSKVTQTNGTGPIGSYTVEVFDTNPEVQGSWVAPDRPPLETNGFARPQETTPIEPAATTADIVVADDGDEGSTYLVRVRANAGTEGSHGYLAGTVKAAGVPDAPDNVAAVFDEATTSTVNVSWDSIAEGTDTDITSYIVSWFNTENQVTGSRGSAAVSGAGTGTYAITGLNPGTYAVQVRAVNPVGKSDVTDGIANDSSESDTPNTVPVVPVPS